MIICLYLYFFYHFQQRNYAYIGNVFSTNNSGEYHGARVCKNKKDITCGTYNHTMATTASYTKKKIITNTITNATAYNCKVRAGCLVA